ncbi:MAG: RNA polymerase sigma factor [Nannocystaceae bacterium]
MDGDSAAWREIYETHFESLLRYVAYATGDVALAEDLAQEAFAIALVRLGSFDGKAPLMTWLRGIAHNLVRKHWRKRSRRSRAYAHLEQMVERSARPRGDDLERALEQESRADALAAALDVLPDTLREAFVLSDVQGMSAAEAAAIAGTTAGNLRVRAARARARLRAQFKRLGLFEEGNWSA